MQLHSAQRLHPSAVVLDHRTLVDTRTGAHARQDPTNSNAGTLLTTTRILSLNPAPAPDNNPSRIPLILTGLRKLSKREGKWRQAKEHCEGVIKGLSEKVDSQIEGLGQLQDGCE